jgi:hypothetical protein
MNVTFNLTQLEKDLNNLVQYSTGYLEGIQVGKTFLKRMGQGTKVTLEKYIDANARLNPQALHHVYEWSKVGSPKARLYDLTYTISNLGLSIKSKFSQSKSIKAGSMEPFYNKAKIMEEGKSITITPKKSPVLAFDIDGQEIFTRNPVDIEYPGGREVQGAYEKIFDEFFQFYFKQSFLRASGMMQYLNNPVMYKKDFPLGVKGGGKSQGKKTGYTWIANATIGVE